MEELLLLQSRIQELTAENEQLKQILAMGNTLCMERNMDKMLPLMMKEIVCLKKKRNPAGEDRKKSGSMVKKTKELSIPRTAP